jgi:hypothetical protein
VAAYFDGEHPAYPGRVAAYAIWSTADPFLLVAVHSTLAGELECSLFWSSVFTWANDRAAGRSVLYAMDANAVVDPGLDRKGLPHRQDRPFQQVL